MARRLWYPCCEEEEESSGGVSCLACADGIGPAGWAVTIDDMVWQGLYCDCEDWNGITYIVDDYYAPCSWRYNQGGDCENAQLGVGVTYDAENDETTLSVYNQDWFPDAAVVTYRKVFEGLLDCRAVFEENIPYHSSDALYRTTACDPTESTCIISAA